MKPLDSRDYLSLLSEIERREDLPEGTFQIVESVADWCADHGVVEGHQDRLAKCLTEKGTGKPLILIKREITSDHIRGILDYMEISGYGDVSAKISDSAHFFEVLAFHEVAHLKLKDPTEEECDRWALARSNR